MDALSPPARIVNLDDIHRIVVQPIILASDPEMDGRDGLDAVLRLYRSHVDTFLRQRLAIYAEGVDVDWSDDIGRAGPRGIVAFTYAGDVLDEDDPRLFDPTCDAHEAILYAVGMCE